MFGVTGASKSGLEHIKYMRMTHKLVFQVRSICTWSEKKNQQIDIVAYMMMDTHEMRLKNQIEDSNRNKLNYFAATLLILI